MSESSGRRQPLLSSEEVERDEAFCERQARLDKAFHAELLADDVVFVTRLITVIFAACEEPSVRAVTLARYLGLRTYWQYTRADLEAATAASHASACLPSLPYVRAPRPPRPPPHERDRPDGPYFDAAPPPLLLTAAAAAATTAAAWVGNPLLLSQGVQSLRTLMTLSRGACDAEETEGLLLPHTHGSQWSTSSSDSHRDEYVAPHLQQVVVDESVCATTALQCVGSSPHLRKRSSMGRTEQHDGSASSVEQEPLLGS